MFVVLVIASVLAGLAAIAALWSYDPLVAILYAPMMASLVTAVFALSPPKLRRSRHGLRYRGGLAAPG
jgi:hypothetical protein